MKIRQAISFVTALALAITLGASPVMAAGDYYPDKDHPDISYDEMVYEGIDLTAIDGYISELSGLAASGRQDDARLAELYGAMMDEFDHLFTQQSLCYIAHNRDGSDKEISEENEKNDELLIDVNDRANAVFSEVAKTSLGPTLEALIAEDVQDEELAADLMDWLREYEPLTDREKKIAADLASLRTEYNEASLASYTVEVNGKVWTSESFEEAPPRSEEEYAAVEQALSSAFNEAAAEIYLEMIPLLDESAELRGFDNYADYANAEAYERDYSSEEQQKLAEDVRTYLRPLLDEINDTIDAESYGRLDYKIAGMTADEMLDTMAPYVGQIDPELQKSFDYLRDKHLYDMDAGSRKLDVGFTTSLDEYGAAFIFNSPYGSFSDFSGATVHEFGHFNEAWHSVVPSFWQSAHLDVSEIASQGLETLFLAYGEDMFGEKQGKAYRDAVIYDLLSATLTACLVNDFETTVLTSGETWTRDSLNELFYELCVKYDYNAGSVEDACWWAEIPHLFESPLYYMAYGTSALGAMDIAYEAQKDRDQGVDKYMRLTALASMYPLRETLEKAGMEDIFSEGAVERIADAMREMLDLPARQGRLRQRILTYLGAFLVCLVLIVVVVIVLIRRAIRRRRERMEHARCEAERRAAAEAAEMQADEWEANMLEASPSPENEDTAALAAEETDPVFPSTGSQDMPQGQDGE